MRQEQKNAVRRSVALLAEGVDRNSYAQLPQPVPQVALLAEGVDRNAGVVFGQPDLFGRPPRGGRG